MKFPQGITLIVALILAIVSYLVANTIELTALNVAIIAFICAVVSPLATGAKSEVDSEQNLTTLYVGNLPYRANETAVRELFSEYGKVQSVRLMKDKHTGKRRGFGFVEISSSDAEKAINALNDSEFQQRTLKVREAKERPEKSNNE